MELDAVVSMECRGTFPLNSIEIDVLIPHGMPWNFFPRKSMEFHGGISYGMYQCSKLFKGLCHAIFYLFKKLKRVFESIEFQE